MIYWILVYFFVGYVHVELCLWANRVIGLGQSRRTIVILSLLLWPLLLFFIIAAFTRQRHRRKKQ